MLGYRVEGERVVFAYSTFGDTTATTINADAKRRGAIQEKILDELTSRAARLDDVDLARADRLIEERLGTAP